MALMRNYNHMKNFLQIFLFITFSTLSYYYLSISFDDLLKENAIEKKDTLITAEINFVGDLMCHSVQLNYAHVKDDSFYFNGTFSEVKKYLSDADFTIGNFETVLAGKKKRYSGYPFFNAPDDFLLAIKEAGFDLLVNANNHAIDKGAKGVERTKEALETGADKIASACPFCMTMLTDGVKHFEKSDEVEVKDIAELVLENSN